MKELEGFVTKLPGLATIGLDGAMVNSKQKVCCNCVRLSLEGIVDTHVELSYRLRTLIARDHFLSSSPGMISVVRSIKLKPRLMMLSMFASVLLNNTEPRWQALMWTMLQN